MSLDPRTPVLVGAGAVSQRIDDPALAREPIELMAAALERAADDAGTRELLRRADRVRVPKGFPPYPDPGRLLAERFGAHARTELADIGILQTTLFGRSARAIATGEEDVVLIAGGEAKYRTLRAQIAGVEPGYVAQDGAVPDDVLRPEGEIMSHAELAHGLAMPVTQYAILENALRHAEGRSLDEHRREVAELWAAMSRVAAENPDAWSREAVSAEEIASPSARNPMLAFPYTKRHTSQWNVDQAAGLILCAAEVASELGIAQHRWLFPLAVTESNHMVPLCERAELHRSHGFRIAGERAFALAGTTAADVAHRELYSCFPVAVRIQLRELGLDPARPVTVTGGMAFAGGPLNNFVLQAMVRMTQVLRASPGEVGLVTAVSGLLTKQGVSLWSTRPGPGPCPFEDVSEDVARALERRAVVDSFAGRARVASGTVLHEAGGRRAVLLCDTPDGRRTLASTAEEAVVAEACETEICGRPVEIAEGAVAFA